MIFIMYRSRLKKNSRQRLPQGSPHCVPASCRYTLLFNSVSHISSSAVQLVTYD